MSPSARSTGSASRPCPRGFSSRCEANRRPRDGYRPKLPPAGKSATIRQENRKAVKPGSGADDPGRKSGRLAVERRVDMIYMALIPAATCLLLLAIGSFAGSGRAAPRLARCVDPDGAPAARAPLVPRSAANHRRFPGERSRSRRRTHSRSSRSSGSADSPRPRLSSVWCSFCSSPPQESGFCGKRLSLRRPARRGDRRLSFWHPPSPPPSFSGRPPSAPPSSASP